MQVGPVIRLYVFSFSRPRHPTYIQLQNGIDDIIIIFEQGENAYKQQRAEVMDTLRQNPLPIYAQTPAAPILPIWNEPRS